MLELCILLVDDEEYALTALSKLLQSKGHAVYAATTVREAIALAKQQRCDLLIADLELPDGTAMDLMRELRSMYPLPGIVLTGYEGEQYKVQSRAAGFDKHLLKPIHFDDLVAAIGEVVNPALRPEGRRTGGSGDMAVLPRPLHQCRSRRGRFK